MSARRTPAGYRAGRFCNGYAPVTAPDAPGGADHRIDAGVHIPEPESLEPTPEPTPPPAEPTGPESNGPAPDGRTPGGGPAETGTSGLGGVITLTAVLLGAGTTVVLISARADGASASRCRSA